MGSGKHIEVAPGGSHHINCEYFTYRGGDLLDFLGGICMVGPCVFEVAFLSLHCQDQAVINLLSHSRVLAPRQRTRRCPYHRGFNPLSRLLLHTFCTYHRFPSTIVFHSYRTYLARKHLQPRDPTSITLRYHVDGQYLSRRRLLDFFGGRCMVSPCDTAILYSS